MSHLQPGVTVQGLAGSYRIVEKRGEGGFGIAWRAEHAGDGHAVLAKELKIGRLSSWKALELFEREAKVLAAIRHERIPRYHDFFATDGQAPLPPSALQGAGEPGKLSLVLVQDFVEGRSLEEMITAGARMTGQDVERLLRELLETLDHLHRLHPPVIHRDINPRNIIVRSDGAPFLVDFGAIQEALRSTEKIGSTNVGTFGFMPLEQTMGRAVPASDLYALGMSVLVAASHCAPSEMPHDEATGRVKVGELAPALPAAVRAGLEAMVAPIAGQRAASARAVLDVMAGKAGGAAQAGGAARAANVAGPVGAAHAGGPLRESGRLPFTLALGLGIVTAAVINLLLFDRFSESMLVRLSFTWLTPLAFGAFGKLFEATAPARNPYPRALLATAGAFLALLVFFGGIWPSPVKRAVALALAATLAGAGLGLGGCAPVRPWERGDLAHRCMRPETRSEELRMRLHMLTARETARGGAGETGGGCGCK